ncbi:RagB/SusD family nutrient uptake outer membrane protein [Niabella ginsengisoli]|uniref:RagB/SusD family nutrient uptake outer membrane protein n=1 Tax=Niabella ginsengisoli TaxID=522298 RepID=A0ABS9SHH1_9BACT|nr:RagB/SusD family nutrient uptake outer membrane protein [Niabella ginsengisoli]MCH5597785.1 RagB/SusD family nutrient uptake outer membrane protein [Niabella ginsengisoli]
MDFNFLILIILMYMKNKILYLIAFISLIAFGCSKNFLEEKKSYDKYDESIFTNEVQTGWYIDRMYNYYFVSYRNPLQSVVGLYNDNRSRMTEEIGGTVGDYINPNKTLRLASEADAYYGASVGGSVQNNPYTRIRFANFLIQKIDEVGLTLPESFRKTAKGQMYFLRALQYFDLVRIYGGVPIVTAAQNASSTDETIREPRATSSECFDQIIKDLDSAATLLPMIWDVPGSNYGRLTAAGALAMKSRVLLTAASPLYNSDWDNSGNERWQKALDAGLQAETALTAAGYGLFGSNAKDWGAMTVSQDNAFNKEALMVVLLSTNSTSSAGYNNSWENSVRPRDYNGGGGLAATKEMLDLFPLANGSRPTENNYVDTFFFENRDPRFYRTYAFSGTKWGTKTNANKSTWFYRWRPSATGNVSYYANNQTNSPAVVRKMSNPAADTTALAFSGTDIFEYRYAELLLNIAECYAAKGDVANTVIYLSKIRERVGITSANNYGIGTLANKYAALEACLYERRIELAYEGKRFWDLQRWMLYDNIAESGNTVQKLGLSPINGTTRNGYYWQAKNFIASDPLTANDRSILIDPDAANFETELAKLKAVYQNKFVMTPLDQAWDRVNNAAVTILFRPNYYLSGLSASTLSNNPWLPQTIGWLDYSGAPGTFNYRQ